MNSLGRRNLSKEKRDEMIQRDFRTSSNEPSINSTSATEELEAKQQEIERLKAERDALAEKQLSAVQSDLAAEIPSAKRLLKVEGVGNPDILRVDGSSLSSRVPFTVRTMNVPYHARKEYRHGCFHADHSFLVGMSRNNTSTNARMMRNECGYDRSSMTAYKTVCDDKTKRR